MADETRPFSVRPYQPGDEAGIVELFNRVFGEGNPAFVPRSLQAWRALYLDNPAGIQTFVATDTTGAIIANYSSIPAACVVKGERRLCTQAVDSCVDKAWRGRLSKRSVFVTIASEFIGTYQRADDYMWGLPNEQAFPIGTRILGYQPVHCPMPALAARATSAWMAELEPRVHGVTVEEFRGEDVGAAAALFEEHLARTPLGIWKDAPYLAWRYRPRADVQYRALLARRSGRLVGVLVFRLGWMGQPLVPLVDWIGPGDDEPALAALLLGVARVAQAAAPDLRLETWVTPGMGHFATLQALGMGREDTRFNLCIMVFGQGLDVPWAKEHWCLTMGDTDIF